MTIEAMLIAIVLTLAAIAALAWRRMARAEREVRELRRLRDELESQVAAGGHDRSLFLQILNGLGEGLLAVGRDRRVVLANRRFAEMFDVHGDLVGRPIGEVARVAAIFDAFDAAFAGRESVDSFAIHTGVSERSFEIRAFPFPSDEIAAVAIFIDVTRLQRLEQVRRDFVSDFSHEARTPLAALKSAVESYELAGTRMSPEEDQQLRRIMARQLSRLVRLVDDLSELSRIESGELRLERSPVALRPLLEGVCEDFSERAAQKRLRFVLTGDDVVVHADAMRIEQAFSNLVDNAIKYGGENNIIEISIAEESDGAVVAIRDHGEGIPPEQTERIFHRFYRADKSRSQEIVGSGLGLAITKHLVLQHAGSIDVESQLGEGSTFIVRLPAG